MFDVFGSVRGLLKIDSVCIDNNVFRLHYKVTVIILVAFSLIVTSRQYIGDPIDCIVDDIQTDVMDAYCWIYSTYTVKSRVMGKIGTEVAAPGVGPYVKEDEIVYHKYYQWVCFALFFQAMLFYVPRYLWKTWEGGKIKTLASDLLGPIVSEDIKQDRKQLLVDFFLANIHNHNFYAFRFFICELLNFINVVVQIYFMDAFMGGEFSSYGWNVLKYMDSNMVDEREDAMERVFPKLTKCKFHTYGSTGSIQLHDGLCILPLNIVNEKIYLFLWFWFFILAIISFISVVYRFFVIANPKLRLYLLRARCRFTSQSQIEQIASRLKIGDWFVLYQLAKNIEPFIFKEIISDIAKSIVETKQAV